MECDESYITLTVKNSDDYEQKKKLMDKWLMSICKDTIQSLCDAIFPKFQKYGVEYPVVKVEISNTSHPFYTGKMKLVDTAGRVDKFYQRYKKK